MKKIIALFALLLSTQVFASNDAMLQLLNTLKERGTLDPVAYESLKSAAQADEETNNAAGAEVGKKVEQSLAQLGTPGLTPGKFELKDKPGDFAWRTIGRIHYDTAFFDKDGKFDQNDAGQFRRLRLGVAGTLNTNWKFKAEYDFRESDKGIEGLKDAYVEYVGKLPGIDPVTHPTSIKIGQSHEPFSFDLINSSNNGLFVERAMPVNALANYVGERNPGIKLTTWTDHFTYSGGIFGTRQQETISDKGADETNPREFNDGYAATGRVTWAPWHDGGHVLHLGSGVSYRGFKDGNTVQLRERMEINETSTRLVDTGKFAADHLLRWNGEFVVIEGPFTLQSEYLGMQVNTAVGSPYFQGYYVSAGWFLTGESRPYKFQEGIFDSVKPQSLVGKGGWGAWELVGRFSDTDLNAGDVIVGGREKNLSVGLNWYPVQNVRFQTNYVKVLDVEGGKYAGSEPSAIVTRMAVFW
jgi:phosphate-selective porin OprO/OprP